MFGFKKCFNLKMLDFNFKKMFSFKNKCFHFENLENCDICDMSVCENLELEVWKVDGAMFTRRFTSMGLSLLR